MPNLTPEERAALRKMAEWRAREEQRYDDAGIGGLTLRLLDEADRLREGGDVLLDAVTFWARRHAQALRWARAWKAAAKDLRRKWLATCSNEELTMTESEENAYLQGQENFGRGLIRDILKRLGLPYLSENERAMIVLHEVHMQVQQLCKLAGYPYEVGAHPADLMSKCLQNLEEMLDR